MTRIRQHEAPGLQRDHWSSASAIRTTETTPPLDPMAIRRLEGRAVVRSPEQLTLHPALNEIGWTGLIEELNDADGMKERSLPEPILITTNGLILTGFGRWRLALFEGSREIHCIEYSLGDDESLQFMITHHRTRRCWNAFVRIRLALRLEPYLQRRALANMRAGGRYKGSANLPEAQHLDVRQQIAEAVGVGTRNVSNVKTILKNAHPRLITALLSGALTINRGMQFCKLPKAEQLEHFIRYKEDREVSKVIRRSVSRPKKKTSADVFTILDALLEQQARHPGSIVVRVGRL